MKKRSRTDLHEVAVSLSTRRAAQVSHCHPFGYAGTEEHRCCGVQTLLWLEKRYSCIQTVLHLCQAIFHKLEAQYSCRNFNPPSAVTSQVYLFNSTPLLLLTLLGVRQMYTVFNCYIWGKERLSVSLYKSDLRVL